MNAIVTAFKHSSHDKVVCHTTPDTLSGTLRGLVSMFGYMSYIEHCHAAHTRFGHDIFAGGSQLVMGGFMHDSRSLLLQQWPNQTPDTSKMGVHEFAVVSTKPDESDGCEYHSFSYTGNPPYVAVRREMQAVNPHLYASITNGAARLSAVRPIWEDVVKDFPSVTVIRPS